ncbi:MAG: hypothetical protein ABH896_04695 [Candidatus Jacksonbacteria bacterium]
MREDKVLQKIHQIQVRFHQTHKGLSWEQEAKLMNRLAKKVAKQYNYPIFPIAKTHGILRDRSQNYNYS